MGFQVGANTFMCIQSFIFTWKSKSLFFFNQLKRVIIFTHGVGKGLIEILYIEYLAQCSAHNKCPVNCNHCGYRFSFYLSKVDPVWMVRNYIDILFCLGQYVQIDYGHCVYVANVKFWGEPLPLGHQKCAQRTQSQLKESLHAIWMDLI